MLLDDSPVDRLAALGDHGNIRGFISGQPAIVTRVTDVGEPGFEIYIERDATGRLKGRLATEGAVELDDQTADVLRVEAGVPEFHRDMDEETIPLEAGIESRAISLTKGCYVGQEVIIRVLHRGHGRVARKLVGLTFDGDAVPERGSIVKSDQKDVGEITSSVRSIALDRPIALAYLQRDFLTPGTTVSADGASGVVTTLPFASG
jgi:folate-binding protein YgfZ